MLMGAAVLACARRDRFGFFLFSWLMHAHGRTRSREQLQKKKRTGVSVQLRHSGSHTVQQRLSIVVVRSAEHSLAAQNKRSRRSVTATTQVDGQSIGGVDTVER
jgi:hypothetical protein